MKFTEAEREKLFAQLEAPFDPALIKWRVMHTFDYGRSGVILPFADPARLHGPAQRTLHSVGMDARVHNLDRTVALPHGAGQADRDQQGSGGNRRYNYAVGQPHRHGRGVGRPRNAVTAADAQAFSGL